MGGQKAVMDGVDVFLLNPVYVMNGDLKPTLEKFNQLLWLD